MTRISGYIKMLVTKRNKYKIAVFFFLSFAFSYVVAKENNYIIQGYVVDNMTGSGMDSIHVILMTPDSTFISKTTALPKVAGKFAGMYKFTIHNVGNYIIKAMCSGYEDGYMNCALRSKREFYVTVKPIRLAKSSYELPEVTVRATKVKMVVQGDTIVYNADAFNLADGSMLDVLISKLPGARLTRDGRIYVTGKYIQSLLVNGREFFSGNPKLALENLPAYTVNKIKVYNKAGVVSIAAGRDMGDKSYVMDVKLKKEYAVGYMSNIEAGAGTKNRYMTRAFGMKFSDKARVGVFTNINNLNDNQRAALNGEWAPQDVGEGLLATKTAGVSYERMLDGKYSWVASKNYWTHINADNQSISSTQTFLPGGNSYQQNQYQSLSRSDNWCSMNELILQEQGYYSINRLSLSYTCSYGLNNSTTETSDEKLQLNRMLSANSLESKNIDFGFHNKNGIKIIADMVRWDFAIDYNRNAQKTFSMNDLQYVQSSLPRDYRNQYIDRLNQDFKLSAGISYNLGFRYISVQPGYNYVFSYNKTDNPLYRLDKLANRDSSLFDRLPSAKEALADVLDNNNTYHYNEYRNSHRFNIYYNNLRSKLLNCDITINLPIRLVYADFYYHRMRRNNVSRQGVFFEPNITLRNNLWEVSAKMSSELPDLTTIVDYRDDSSPLRTILGNPQLRNIHEYDVNVNRTFKGKKQMQLNIQVGYHQTDNAVAYGLTFNKQKGVSTIQPVSVNGNRKYNVGVGYTRALNKSEKVTIDNQMSLNYNHNVDMATVEGYTESQRNIVNNWQIGDVLKLNYRPNDHYEFLLHGGGNYYLINSKCKGFSNIHAGDYNIGANAQISLLWKFQITTDLTMFARCGYQQNEMNSTHWIWNAQLTRSFVKGRLLCKLQGFDILHQLSNTQYVMNAQGRTETFHNSIPRYVMFSVSWRFNVNPKKT